MDRKSSNNILPTWSMRSRKVAPSKMASMWALLARSMKAGRIKGSFETDLVDKRDIICTRLILYHLPWPSTWVHRNPHPRRLRPFWRDVSSKKSHIMIHPGSLARNQSLGCMSRSSRGKVNQSKLPWGRSGVTIGEVWRMESKWCLQAAPLPSRWKSHRGRSCTWYSSHPQGHRLSSLAW